MKGFRRPASTLQNWILFFCWVLPGLSLVGSFWLSFVLTYPGGGRWDKVAPLILFGIPILAAIGCGAFRALIVLTLESGHEAVSPARVASSTFAFILVQIILSPLLAIIAVLACGVISSSL